jgi:hypothetical protein
MGKLGPGATPRGLATREIANQAKGVPSKTALHLTGSGNYLNIITQLYFNITIQQQSGLKTSEGGIKWMAWNGDLPSKWRTYFAPGLARRKQYWVSFVVYWRNLKAGHAAIAMLSFMTGTAGLRDSPSRPGTWRHDSKRCGGASYSSPHVSRYRLQLSWPCSRSCPLRRQSLRNSLQSARAADRPRCKPSASIPLGPT